MYIFLLPLSSPAGPLSFLWHLRFKYDLPQDPTFNCSSIAILWPDPSYSIGKQALSPYLSSYPWRSRTSSSFSIPFSPQTLKPIDVIFASQFSQLLPACFIWALIDIISFMISSQRELSKSTSSPTTWKGQYSNLKFIFFFLSASSTELCTSYSEYCTPF